MRPPSTLGKKKLRGVSRRLRALRKWSDRFRSAFPPPEALDPRYRKYNWKLPVRQSFVEDPYFTGKPYRIAAQLLIDACAHLLAAKPVSARTCRVTCCVCIPDLFTSEVCIYTDEEYFLSKVETMEGCHGEQTAITGRSLAAEWGLVLPPSVSERGTLWRYDQCSDPEDAYVSEHWNYGEVF